MTSAELSSEARSLALTGWPRGSGGRRPSSGACVKRRSAASRAAAPRARSRGAGGSPSASQRYGRLVCAKLLGAGVCGFRLVVITGLRRLILVSIPGLTPMLSGGLRHGRAPLLPPPLRPPPQLQPWPRLLR